MFLGIVGWIESFARYVMLLRGWRRVLFAKAAGALTVLALAPFHFWLVPFVTLPVLVWVLDGLGKDGRWRRFKGGAFVGWAFGFGYFLAGLYWIGGAFLVEAERFAWLMPFAVSLMPAGLALFYAVATGLAHLFWRPGASRCVALAIFLASAEWVRGHVLTGFPWNALGYTLTGHDVLLQSASLLGIYGLGFFAVLFYSLPSLYFGGGWSMGVSRKILIVHTAVSVFLLLLMVVYGAARLSTKSVEVVPDVKLRIVQPNIAQVDKWRKDKQQWIFSRFLDLSQRGEDLKKTDLQGVTHLIWPESALPFLLARAEAAKSAISAILPQGTFLLTGALRMENGVRPRVYNSLFVADWDLRLLHVYDKIHLVPFGEYLPFQEMLEVLGLEQLTRIRGGLATGSGPRILAVPGAPRVSPLICYEIVFSGNVADRDKRPGWILNVTNDAWFGQTTGPYQHLHQARVRAVEEGLPVVRAANTGVSAVIDSYGKITQKLPLNEAGVIDSSLPSTLPPTLFVRFGPYVFIVLLLCFTSYFLLLFRQELDH